MTVIADTSPIHYAVAIELGDIYFDLYARLVLPPAVWQELAGDGAPADLHAWLSSNRGRIEVRPVVVPADPRLAVLDPGEREAIALAEITPGALLIIDERDGREEATRRGISITGLLGVIRDAGLRRMLDFDNAIRRLKATDFRLSPSVEAMVRKQYSTGAK